MSDVEWLRALTAEMKATDPEEVAIALLDQVEAESRVVEAESQYSPQQQRFAAANFAARRRIISLCRAVLVQGGLDEVWKRQEAEGRAAYLAKAVLTAMMEPYLTLAMDDNPS